MQDLGTLAAKSVLNSMMTQIEVQKENEFGKYIQLSNCGGLNVKGLFRDYPEFPEFRKGEVPPLTEATFEKILVPAIEILFNSEYNRLLIYHANKYPLSYIVINEEKTMKINSKQLEETTKYYSLVASKINSFLKCFTRNGDGVERLKNINLKQYPNDVFDLCTRLIFFLGERVIITPSTGIVSFCNNPSQLKKYKKKYNEILNEIDKNREKLTHALHLVHDQFQTIKTEEYDQEIIRINNVYDDKNDPNKLKRKKLKNSALKSLLDKIRIRTKGILNQEKIDKNYINVPVDEQIGRTALQYLIDFCYEIDRNEIFSHIVVEEFIVFYSPVIKINMVYSQTALHKAVKNNFIKTVDVLLKYGADPSVIDYFGLVPVSYAFANNYEKIINKLLFETKSKYSIMSNEIIPDLLPIGFLKNTKILINLIRNETISKKNFEKYFLTNMYILSYIEEIMKYKEDNLSSEDIKFYNDFITKIKIILREKSETKIIQFLKDIIKTNAFRTLVWYLLTFGATKEDLYKITDFALESNSNSILLIINRYEEKNKLKYNTVQNYINEIIIIHNKGDFKLTNLQNNTNDIYSYGNKQILTIKYCLENGYDVNISDSYNMNYIFYVIVVNNLDLFKMAWNKTKNKCQSMHGDNNGMLNIFTFSALISNILDDKILEFLLQERKKISNKNCPAFDKPLEELRTLYVESEQDEFSITCATNKFRQLNYMYNLDRFYNNLQDPFVSRISEWMNKFKDAAK